MGECRSDECDRITKETWVIDYNIWLSVAYIPDKRKVVADKLSREFNMIVGWQLHLAILEKISAAFNPLSIALFASRIIGRLRIYVSCKSDPDILLIDAFLINCAIKVVLSKVQTGNYKCASDDGLLFICSP